MQKIYSQKWKWKFEGCFLKGNSWCNLGSCTNTWRVDTTTTLWFFTTETNTFWSCFQYLHDFWRILMQTLRIIFQIVWGLTISSEFFVNFRVIHVLLSLILFYWIMLDQISHTWFEWNLVNGCTAWNCHPICMQLVECRLCLKTYWEKEKKSHC